MPRIRGTFSNPCDDMPEIPGIFSNPCDDVPEIPGTFSNPCDDMPAIALIFSNPCDDVPAIALAFSNPCDDVPAIALTFSNPCDDVPENPGTFSNPYDDMPRISGKCFLFQRIFPTIVTISAALMEPSPLASALSALNPGTSFPIRKLIIATMSLASTLPSSLASPGIVSPTVMGAEMKVW